MKIIEYINFSIISAAVIYVMYKAGARSRKKEHRLHEFNKDNDFENNLLNEMELIIDTFKIRCISHNIFKIITKKNLSEEIWSQAFKDNKVEYGFPIINFPTKFFSENGIKILSNWLTMRGVEIKSEGAIVMLISEFLMKETRPQAEKIVEEAIAAIEKQKAG